MKRLLLALSPLLIASPADAFWQSKREICAQYAAYGAGIPHKTTSEYWKKLGIKKSIPSDMITARNMIWNYCKYYKN